ncbi:MAG TPA: 50S ribosomal protein L10 [Acidimicrobiales bacterium]|nr:50S ribosomal protein L10 [Acidimicrobiales bacterium]
MDNPRADKVAVVDEVRGKLAAADGAVLTEYRGLSVSELADLRRELAAAGGDYKIYKNTLVRLAVAGGPQESVTDLLVGPTAIAFVQGDVSAVAKALRDFSRTNPNLVIKGGIIEDGLLSASEMTVLADLPPRQTLLAQFAGALSAPMQQLAGLIEALPRNLAYGLSALLDQKRAESGPEPEAAAPATPEPTAEAEAPTETTESTEAPAAATEAPADVAEAPAETTATEAPAEAAAATEAPEASAPAADEPAAEATETPAE